MIKLGKNKQEKSNNTNPELFLKNVMEQITEIIKVEFVEGIEESRMGVLKLKAIELLSEYAMKKMENPDLWKYPIYSTPDFGAYFRTEMGSNQTTLVFRTELNVTMHSYYDNAEDVLKAINYLFGRKLEKEEEATHQR